MIVQVIFNERVLKPQFSLTAGYRPHFALPNSEHLMGIEFVEIMGDFVPNKPVMAEVRLMYEGVDYSALLIGTKFDIREGQR